MCDARVSHGVVSTGLVSVVLAVVLGCGTEEPSVPRETAPVIEAPRAPHPSSAPSAGTSPGGEPDLAAWSDRPSGFELVRLPPTTDPCDGFVVWVGLDAVRVTRRASGPSTEWPTEPSAPGIEGEVARAIGSPLFLLSGAYDGPGGEPLFRWHLESAQVILVFDRRIDRERFVGALRGAGVAAVVRVGGIDAEGRARCALVATHAPDDLSAQAENQTFEGRVEPDGTLVVPREGLPEARLGAASEALPTEPETGLHMVEIEVQADASPAAYLDAAARARWADRRYGYFALAP